MQEQIETIVNEESKLYYGNYHEVIFIRVVIENWAVGKKEQAKAIAKQQP